MVEEGSEDQKNRRAHRGHTERVQLITGLGAKPRAQMVTAYKHERWGVPRADHRPLRTGHWCL